MLAPDFRLVCKLAAVLDVPEAYFYAVEDELACSTTAIENVVVAG
ncbi:hypothetical protein M989_01169 [Kluyvera georgiana ATCC 51603]|uniref:Uncharacterized protein n=1 Tax=Kluyvera georgiana ATCC 51603 TaxID=1354264 RepID=A0A1B7K5C0_9ENTR|nr:hypothetical protein M989_01169 [Kluyvera georgiana ATCC 51603]